jgi:hypothetical protein
MTVFIAQAGEGDKPKNVPSRVAAWVANPPPSAMNSLFLRSRAIIP